jgi:DnaK suppressor protein
MQISPYSLEFIEECRARLTELKQQLINNLKEVATFDQVSGKWDAKSTDADQGAVEDVADEADDSSELIGHDAEAQDFIGQLDDVEIALNKIAEGTYGWDEGSQEYISEDRLKAYPAAQRVVDESR